MDNAWMNDWMDDGEDACDIDYDAQLAEAASHIVPVVQCDMYPSSDDLENLPHDRARAALHVWYRRLRELIEYKNQNGRTSVPQAYPLNCSLGVWVNKQRSLRLTLSTKKVALLDSIGFDWGSRRGDYAWNHKFEQLVAYKEEHGHCLVPTKYKENKTLGRWICAQRDYYKKQSTGEHTTLTDERIRRLNEIGFVWAFPRSG